jgi:hypothetical protein
MMCLSLEFTVGFESLLYELIRLMEKIIVLPSSLWGAGLFFRVGYRDSP